MIEYKKINVVSYVDIPTDGNYIVDYEDDSTRWMVDGKYHREDGPAIKYLDGAKEWYKHGKLHRGDGPASIECTGDEEYWLDGVVYSKQKYYKELFKRGLISEEDYIIEFI